MSVSSGGNTFDADAGAFILDGSFLHDLPWPRGVRVPSELVVRMPPQPRATDQTWDAEIRYGTKHRRVPAIARRAATQSQAVREALRAYVELVWLQRLPRGLEFELMIRVLNRLHPSERFDFTD